MSIITETLENGVIKTWNADTSIYTFTVPNSNRATTDTYIDAVLETIRNWDSSKPYYGIEDITNPAVSLTPYMRGRLPEITKLFKEREITAYIGLVMDSSFTAGVMNAFGRILSMNNRYIVINSFTDISKAQEWLTKQGQK
jgi:hypothetical protein